MSNIRTVSDTKRAFYTAHTRPISSIYRRVVEELMVEMHLLSVNVEFRYDPIYALGVITTFSRFMQGYRPEKDVNSIFSAICSAVGGASAEQYRDDAEQLKVQLSQASADDLFKALQESDSSEASTSPLASAFHAIAQKSPNFKYSRLFAIGLLTVLELIDESVLTDEDKLSDWLGRFCEALDLPREKVMKDIELYRSNLDKLRQAQEVLADVLKADRKKRMEKESAKDSKDEADGDSSAAEAISSEENSEGDAIASSSDS